MERVLSARRRVAWLPVAFVLACGGPRPATRVSDEPTLALIGDGGIVCAAIAVTPVLAVTANHCLKDEVVVFVAPGHAGRQARNGLGRVVWREASSDLAAFAAEGLVPAELAEGRLDLEQVTVVVTHVPEPWTQATVHPDGSKAGFLLTEKLRIGMSGSGLFDERGRLVGVAVGNDGKRGYFAGTERISALIRGTPGGARSRALSVELRSPALWDDESPTVEEMLETTRRRSDQLGQELRRLVQRKRDDALGGSE